MKPPPILEEKPQIHNTLKQESLDVADNEKKEGVENPTNLPPTSVENIGFTIKDGGPMNQTLNTNLNNLTIKDDKNETMYCSKKYSFMSNVKIGPEIFVRLKDENISQKYSFGQFLGKGFFFCL